MSSENYLIINLSVTDLLEIYRQAPKVLLRCATKVSVKEESLQKLNQEPVFLVKVRNGNYWVIATEDANFYWLLPKSNLRVNSFEYQSVQYLFECQGYQPDTINHFTLIHPARASFAGKEWKLEHRGKLEFGEKAASFQVQPELEQAQEDFQQFQAELKELRSRLSQSKSENEQLQSSLHRKEQERQQLLSNLEHLAKTQQPESQSQLTLWEQLFKQMQQASGERKLLQSLLQEFNQEFSNLKDRVDAIEDLKQLQQNTKQELQENNRKNELIFDDSTQSSSEEITERYIEESIIDLVINYNRNPDYLLKDAIEVKIKSHINKNFRINSNQPILFEKVSRNKGICWIINIKGINYLVPIGYINQKISKPTYTQLTFRRVRDLFICHNFQLENSVSFVLLKPGKLSQLSDKQTWKLVEKGELEFKQR